MHYCQRQNEISLLLTLLFSRYTARLVGIATPVSNHWRNGDTTLPRHQRRQIIKSENALVGFLQFLLDSALFGGHGPLKLLLVFAQNQVGSLSTALGRGQAVNGAAETVLEVSLKVVSDFARFLINRGRRANERVAAAFGAKLSFHCLRDATNQSPLCV